MSKIRVLPDYIANQIAAGEVVERPASVAKELVENSVDGGARRIEIEIEMGGRRLLRVTDDGEGMTRDDAVLAFERHATSKINRTEDLASIRTLGFRGEALASIASVARVELVTKNDEEPHAARVLIEGGRMRDVQPAAHPRGTTIAVRDLFFNVPARRKFLRSEATESFHLTNLVTHYALAHPEIAFTLTNQGREVLHAAPAADLRERAYQIFGAEFLNNLLEVNGGLTEVTRVRGYVSAPRERRTTRDAQYLFVNGRFVRDRLISRALSEGYRAVLPHGVYPAALLFLDVPLEEVDVNVHPAKTEVRFRRAAAVADVVRESVRAALAQHGVYPRTPESFREADAKGDVIGALEEFLQASGVDSRQHDRTAQAAPVSSTPDQTPDDEYSSDQYSGEQHYSEGEHTKEVAPKSKVEAPLQQQQQGIEFSQPALQRDDSLGHDSAQHTASIDASSELAALRSAQEEHAPIPYHSTSDHSTPDASTNSGFAVGGSITPGQEKPAQQQTPPQTLASPVVRRHAPSLPSASKQSAQLPPLASAANLVREVALESLSANIRPLGQLEESFIIATDDEGLLLIDQHVAHERILFDKYHRLEGTRIAESQNLLLPETFDLTPAQAAAFESVAAELESYGFVLMRLSGRTVAIKAVPADLPADEARNLLAEVLDAVDAERRGAARATLRDQIAASLACRAAIKINTPLAPEKMRWLVDRLLTTSSPTTCPHGRPILLRLTTRDIEKGFHRS